MKKKIENTIEKIGATVSGKELDVYLEKKNIEKDEAKEEDKNINQRIEDLVNEMEKNNHLIAKIWSLRSAFIRGLFQGLGIIIGSTILAGMLYSLSINILGKDFIKEMTLNYILEKEMKVENQKLRLKFEPESF